jgi:hypothetical protein
MPRGRPTEAPLKKCALQQILLVEEVLDVQLGLSTEAPAMNE